MQLYMEILTCESLRKETIIIGYQGGRQLLEFHITLRDQKSAVSLEVEEMKFKEDSQRENLT